MKLNKAIVRILAVVMIAAMSAGLFGCVSSYNTNPTVAKVGNQKLGLEQYLSLYNNTDTSSNIYYMYLQYGAITREQYSKYILEELVNYGVQLDQIEKQGVKLDDEEEAKLQQDVEDTVKEQVNKNFLDKVDSSITDEAAKYEAALELLKADLKKNGVKFEDYRANIEKNLRTTALISKLREVNIADVTVSNDDVKKYFEDNVKTTISASDFRTAFNNFMTASTTIAPLFMPHPERAVEDDPETTDKDESKDADPYGEFFSVVHLLMKFETGAGADVTDLAEYAAGDKTLTDKMNEFEATIGTLTTEDFIAKCFDKDSNDDAGMQQTAYQYFGYLMQASILDSYYKGFGYASMKLKFGEDWEPVKDSETSTAEPETYDVKFFDLADGAKIVKVYTTSGAHYIILNPNDCFSMYDDDGYLMVPLYEDDNPVTAGEGILTANGGHMTQAQLDAINAILANVKEPVEEEAQKDTETETEEHKEEEPYTLKTLYENIRDAKLTSMQSEAFNNKFNEWKENTKIVRYENIIKSFGQG
ncbi:MAG: SurA N-terminal domain-containing protein [Clostridia bacterium]|nr:SurA N-terminal domain-containing protein [Clostridia bacterium]